MRVAIDHEQAQTILKGFGGKRVLVIGDIMLDEFLWGRCDRISPEAPVPVVRVADETYKLGGAGNVAHNMAALGADVSLVTVVGEDRFGDSLMAELERAGISTEGVVRDPSRPTTVKTRILAHSQQLIRADRESCTPVEGEAGARTEALIATLINDRHAVVVSDYAKGAVTAATAQRLLARSVPASIPVFVDPSVKHFHAFKGATLIIPNALKAERLTRIELKDGEARLNALRRLAESAEASVLLTLGENGMMLFHEGAVTRIPAVAREVYDVTGASDTVISTYALAYAAGASMIEASILANFAAGIVVGKVGTATVTRQEILREIKIRHDEENGSP